jgi:ABC-type transport system involved in cytochrome bd biosynthesis fused ATPase/permease subunit
MNDYATTRAAEARRLTTAATLVCGLALFAALVPAVGHAANLAVGVALGLVLAVLAVRCLARWARERREDRADALIAARWRAVHAPHLLDAHDYAQLTVIGHPSARLVPTAVAEGVA